MSSFPFFLLHLSSVVHFPLWRQDVSEEKGESFDGESCQVGKSFWGEWKVRSEEKLILPADGVSFWEAEGKWVEGGVLFTSLQRLQPIGSCLGISHIQERGWKTPPRIARWAGSDCAASFESGRGNCRFEVGKKIGERRNSTSWCTWCKTRHEFYSHTCSPCS